MDRLMAFFEVNFVAERQFYFLIWAMSGCFVDSLSKILIAAKSV